jgi:putative transposase
MRILGYVLMPNHFHLVLWPHADGDLSRWMQWLMTSHVRRYHRHYDSSGHVWQGRFKAFPIEQDEHLATVLRYVERNPLRANLVERAEDWKWSSLAWRRYGAGEAVAAAKRPAMLAKWPISCPRDWVGRVNAPQTPAEVQAIQHSIHRGAPFGEQQWKERVAEQLGIEAALRPRGRPRKAEK